MARPDRVPLVHELDLGGREPALELVVVLVRVHRRELKRLLALLLGHLGELGHETDEVLGEVLHPQPPVDPEAAVVGVEGDPAVRKVAVRELLRGGHRDRLVVGVDAPAGNVLRAAQDKERQPPEVHQQRLARDLRLAVAELGVLHVRVVEVGEHDQLGEEQEELERRAASRLG